MAVERGRAVGSGTLGILWGGHGCPGRAPVAPGPGSHEGECRGQVGGARVSAGGRARLERTRREGPAWARAPGFALPLSYRPPARLRASVSRGQASAPVSELRLAVFRNRAFCRSATAVDSNGPRERTVSLSRENDSCY